MDTSQSTKQSISTKRFILHDSFSGFISPFLPQMNLLVETKTMRQARQRTYSLWTEGFPSPIEMVKAGYFLVKSEQNQIFAVCFYCHSCHRPQNHQENPRAMHEQQSPNCVFHKVLCPPGTSVLQFNSNPLKRSPRMTTFYGRRTSFDEWPSQSLHPPFEQLAREGFFYESIGTHVRCFCCQEQGTITSETDDLNQIHQPQCKHNQFLAGDLTNLHSF